MAWKDYRQESRKNWGTETDGSLSHDQIKLGALLRIADALELVSKNHRNLIDERDRFEKYYREEQNDNQTQRRRVAGLKGYIRRLKRKKK